MSFDLDKEAYNSPPSIGPLELVAEPSVVVRGTHQVLDVLSNSVNWSDEALSPDNWTLAGTGNVPLVAACSFPDPGDKHAVLLETDRTLVEGVTYTLTPAAAHAGGGVPDPATFVGLRASLPAPEAEDAPLLDIDAPMFRDGEPGAGGYTITDGGDYALKGGIATILKLAWARLLTARGELYWSPDFGTRLQHKRLRPRDLEDEQTRLERLMRSVPRVQQSAVGLSWDGAELVVSVSLVTDLGEVRDERRFGR